jgi:DMSO reductase anchor subunit
MVTSWAQILFTVLAALSAGVLAITAGAALCGKGNRLQQPGAIITVASLLLGGVASLSYLGHPERIFAVFANLASALTQGTIALALSLAVAVTYLVKVRRHSQVSRSFAAVSVICAVAMMVVLSRFYIMPDRPALTGILLLASSFALAGFLGSFTVFILVLFGKESSRVRSGFALCAVLTFVACAVLLVGASRAMMVVPPLPGGGNGVGGAAAPVFLEHNSNGGGSGYGEGGTPAFLDQQN